MISFVTLFLGLVLGPQPIELMVGDEVSRVVLQVDGATIATLASSPWVVEHDFGDRLMPHDLAAIAYDGEGRELARAHQRLNLPRQPVEATVVIRGDPEGKRRFAHISWESRNGARPAAVTADFDGTAIAVVDAGMVPLPPHDPQELHFLRVEVEFDDGSRSTSEVTFGGSYLDSVSSQVTPVLVELQGRRKLPAADKLSGWFSIDSRRPRVLATETGEADILVVRSRLSVGDLRWAQKQELSKALPDAHWRRARLFGSEDWELRMVWPIAHPQAGNRTPFELFPYSQPEPNESGSLVRWLIETDPPEDLRGHQRLADAVAVAGIAAATGSHRRAVVLILGQAETDESMLSPETVREFLRALRVPLYVWSTRPESEAGAGWGDVAETSTADGLKRAVDDLLKRLDRQRIVWLDGAYLPQTIALTPDSKGVSLASNRRAP